MKPRMLTFDEYFSEEMSEDDIAKHHGFNNWDEIVYSIFEETDRFSSEEAYDGYKHWYIRNFTKLGQALK